MKLSKIAATAFAFIAATCFAGPILPTTEWQDIKPDSTLEEVGKGAGLASTNDVNAIAKQMASGATDLWSADQARVFTAYGQQYGVHQEDNGAWEQIAANGVLHIYTNGTYVSSRSWYSWKAIGNNELTYCPTNGAIYRYVNSKYEQWHTIETNLNPHIDNLGSFTNNAATDGNIFKFAPCGLVKNPEPLDIAIFKNSIANDAVTGIRIGSTDQYSKGNFTIPNYATDINALNDKIYNKDMAATWPSYQTNSVVGRILALEGGGANEAYLKKTRISYFFDETTTADSIVSNITRNTNAIADNKKTVERDYVKYATATSIAEHVAKDKITSTVNETYIQGKNFYNKDEVNNIISNKVEQKRIQHLYDDEEDPWQRVDSEGRLYKYEIQDVGGYWTATFVENGVTNSLKLLYSKQNGYYRWETQSTPGTFDPYHMWLKLYSSGALVYDDWGTITYMPANICPTNSTASLLTNFVYTVPNGSGGYLPGKTLTCTYTMQHKELVQDPYDSFSRKSTTDKQFNDANLAATNFAPRLYVTSGQTGRKTNALFDGTTVDIGDAGAIKQLDQSTFIRIPLNTAFNSKVEVGFTAMMPNTGSGKSYVFLRGIDSSSAPTIWYTNGAVNASYSSGKTSQSMSLGNGESRIVKLTIDKESGAAAFTVSNAAMTAGSTMALPNCKATSFGDCIYLTYEDTVGMGASMFSVLVDSIYVKYNDGEKNMLVGQWPDAIVPTQQLYADRRIAYGDSIVLKPATSSDYGLVKPDGATVRINADGQLVVDAGGVDLSDVAKLLSMTNMNDQAYAGYSESSIVGITTNTSMKVQQLSTQVQELIDSISNLNARIEAVINGN